MTDKIAPFTFEEAAEIDSIAYFTAMEALERAEKRSGMSRANIAKRSNIAASSITRVLSGSSPNITLKSLFRIMSAMNRKVFITSKDLSELKHLKPNFSFEPPNFEVTIRGSIHVIGAVASKASRFSNVAQVRPL